MPNKWSQIFARKQAVSSSDKMRNQEKAKTFSQIFNSRQVFPDFAATSDKPLLDIEESPALPTWHATYRRPEIELFASVPSIPGLWYPDWRRQRCSKMSRGYLRLPGFAPRPDSALRDPRAEGPAVVRPLTAGGVGGLLQAP